MLNVRVNQARERAAALVHSSEPQHFQVRPPASFLLPLSSCLFKTMSWRILNTHSY
jgi:hypothetical protein